MNVIAGYTFGTEQTAHSPLTLSDLELLKQTVLFTNEDAQYLRMAGEVLEDQIAAVLDVWYGFVAANSHLVYYFSKAGQPNSDYLTAVRKRFAQWILDTCNRPYDHWKK